MRRRFHLIVQQRSHHIKGWYKVTAKIEVRASAIYSKKSPVFNTLSVEPWQESEESVPTFFYVGNLIIGIL